MIVLVYYTIIYYTCITPVLLQMQCNTCVVYTSVLCDAQVVYTHVLQVLYT